jgi:virulence-associated protein VapD
MYAITFDLETEALKARYHNDSYTNAYGDIRKVLSEHGFEWQQGSVYFGTSTVDAVTCVLAVQDVTTRHPWFSDVVRDIRMLRIEENNNLMPAVLRASGGGSGGAKKNLQASAAARPSLKLAS